MPDATPRELYQYVATGGLCHFREWLQGLRDSRARAKIRIRLDRVKLGNLGDHHRLGGGLHELRIDYGPGYRVYFGQDGERVILLLCGGNKASQIQDIEEARVLWAEYGRRRHDDASRLPA